MCIADLLNKKIELQQLLVGYTKHTLFRCRIENQIAKLNYSINSIKNIKKPTTITRRTESKIELLRQFENTKEYLRSIRDAEPLIEEVY